MTAHSAIRLPRPSELRSILGFRRPRLSPLARRLERALTVEDLRQVARRRTPRAVFDYTDGGADRELTLARNRSAFARAEFVPSVLRDVSNVDPSTTLLGGPAALPLMLAPTGFTRMMHHQGEPAVARAAGRAGLPYALSTMGTTTPEDLAAAASSTRRWFQLYLWRDRVASIDLVRRAAACGFDTLILTVDTSVAGLRLRDIRNGMTVPPSLTMRTLLDGSRHPKWWLNLLFREPLKLASIPDGYGTVADLSNAIFDSSVTINDVAWLREQWDGKLVVKGLQTSVDARRVVEHGVDAVVVSNHGGRQLDRGLLPLEQVGSVVEAVGDRAEVYVDGGVLSGSDMAVALGLGAHGVLIGRAYLYGLMAGGEAGVNRVLDILRDEFITAMQLIGVSTVAELRENRAQLRAYQ